MPLRALLALALLAGCLTVPDPAAAKRDITDRVRDRFADNDGVRIHYVVKGTRKAPLVVLIHGFPDFWYGWRDQIHALSKRWRVAAIDQRGYNLSDAPADVAQYDFALLIADVAAVIRAEGRNDAVIVGHDWGGAVAWMFAILRPEMTRGLVTLNLPHPRGLLRELRENPEQLANSAYARIFQEDGAHLGLTAEALAAVASGGAEETVRARYLEAFQRSSFEGMLAYYERNYPRAPYADVPLPLVEAPVLVIHGVDDPFVLAAGHDGTWQWVAQPVTLVTLPGVGHFVQRDASALVTRTLEGWLSDHVPRR